MGCSLRNREGLAAVKRVSKLFCRFGGGRCRQIKFSVLCCKVIDACTTSNDVWVKSKFVLNVMLEPNVDLHTVAIPPPRDLDWRGNDFTSNPLGANSTVFASSPWALTHVSATKKRSTPLSFINVDISQRLQAISLAFTDCALNEATMNECKKKLFLFTHRLERWRRGRWYPMLAVLPNRCRPLRGWKTRPEKERQGRPNRHHSIPAPRERGLIQPFFRWAGPWTPSCGWRGFWPYRGMSRRIPDRQPRLGLATCVRQK